jgi:RNA polymerase sigma factor (sigma-70 family)
MAWEQDLATLARDRGSALVAYAYLLVGEQAAAQDLVQDAMVATFSRRHPDEVEHLEAHVRRAILNAFLNARRRRARWDGIVAVVADDDARPAGPAPDAAAAARVDVHAALARLTPRERACVVLRHFEDLPVRDIADRLDLSEGAVKRYLSDARRRLAPMLGTDEDVDVHLVGGTR